MRGVLALALLLPACGYVGGTKVEVGAGLLLTTSAKVGQVYNAGTVSLEVRGGGSVEILSVDVEPGPPGLSIVPAMFARSPDGEAAIGASEGDPVADVPGLLVRSPHGMLLTASDRRWYLLIRAQPTEAGRFEVGEVTVRYRSGRRTWTVHSESGWIIEAKY